MRKPTYQSSNPPTRERVRYAAALVLFLGSVDANAQDNAASPAASDAARVAEVDKRANAAFNEGVTAYRRGDYATAREAFIQAYELDPSYRAAAVLGQTEEKLGNLAQAASLLNWALYRLDAQVEPEAKARMDADLVLLKNRVLTLKLITQVPLQEVLIDDLLFTSNSVRVLPAGNDAWVIYLDTASHNVVVRSEGYAPQQRQVRAPAGTAVEWRLQWEQETAGVEADPVPKPWPERAPATQKYEPRSDKERQLDWQLPVAIATGGLALVGAGIGLHSLKRHSRASEDFDTAKAGLFATALPEPCGRDGSSSTRPMCDAMVASADARVIYGDRAVVALSAAGVLVLTSTVFWIWWAKADDSSVGYWTLSPVVDTAYWGGALGGQF